jgi:hypothetical protein
MPELTSQCTAAPAPPPMPPGIASIPPESPTAGVFPTLNSPANPEREAGGIPCPS